MSKIHKLNALAASVVVSALGAGVAQAATANPFAAADVVGAYRQLAGAEGACGNHGSSQPKAADNAGKVDAEGKCGEGKCGEGKCGGEMKDKAAAEGKCGEGKCGADMMKEKPKQ